MDFDCLKQVGLRAVAIAVTGMALPIGLSVLIFGLGFPQYSLFPEALTAGCALAPTSVGVAVSLLVELNQVSTPLGQTIVASAALDDVLSLVLLIALVNVSEGADATSIILVLVFGLAFLAVGVGLIGMKLAPRLPMEKLSEPNTVLLMAAALIGASTIGALLGSYLLGAFTAGTWFVGRTAATLAWDSQVKRFTRLLIRLFFGAVIAFAIPVQELFQGTAFVHGALLGIVCAILGKVAVSALGGHLPFRERMALGAAMVGRGELGYLIAGMAKDQGLLSYQMFVVTTWALLIATLAAPLLFQQTMRRHSAQADRKSSHSRHGCHGRAAADWPSPAGARVGEATDLELGPLTATRKTEAAVFIWGPSQDKTPFAPLAQLADSECSPMRLLPVYHVDDGHTVSMVCEVGCHDSLSDLSHRLGEVFTPDQGWHMRVVAGSDLPGFWQAEFRGSLRSLAGAIQRSQATEQASTDQVEGATAWTTFPVPKSFGRCMQLAHDCGCFAKSDCALSRCSDGSGRLGAIKSGQEEAKLGRRAEGDKCCSRRWQEDLGGAAFATAVQGQAAAGKGDSGGMRRAAARGLGTIASRGGMSPLRLGVLCVPDSPAAKHAQALASDVEVAALGDDPSLFRRAGALDALLIVPPADVRVLDSIWEECRLGDSVKWVHSFSAGVDAMAQLSRSRLAPAGIPLSNGRSAFSESLAEYVMASALHFNKQIPRCQSNLAEKRWDRFTMATLRGRKMGFVGFGDIAQCSAGLARAFGLEIGVLRRDPSKRSESGLEGRVYTSKDELLAESDFVVCTLPGTPATRHYFSSAEFASMKPGAVFISCGRGVCVDESALAAAISGGQDLFAALDVFEQEPLPADSPLWSLPSERLLITAHNADLTEDYFELGWELFTRNMDRFRAGKALATPVDIDAGY